MDIDDLEWRAHDLGFDILDPQPDRLRTEAEQWCGGDFRRVFIEGVLPHVPRKALIVELGSSGGSWTQAFLQGIPDCTVATFDPDSNVPNSRLSRWGTRVQSGRLVRGRPLDLPAGCADFLFSFGFLSHCSPDDIESLLGEMRRVARPGAKALLHYGDWRKRASFEKSIGKTVGSCSLADTERSRSRIDASIMTECARRSGWCMESADLGYLQRDGLLLLGVDANQEIPESRVANTADVLDGLREALESAPAEEALALAIRLKSLHRQIPELDYLRALAFKRLGRIPEVLEACREELRWNPGNAKALDLLQSLQSRVALPPLPDDQEFRDLFVKIKPYTMLSVHRLWSLFSHAREICREDLPGNFVECGVAAGGSSALLTWVVKKYSIRPRKVFSLDTFEGMPPPTAEDIHEGVAAEDTGWGTATCSAPTGSLLKICTELGTSDIVEPVVGLFQETLPKHRARIGEVAFLHMDGDWYDSTMTILVNLYDQITPRGFIQVDDYGHWDGCRKAIHEFANQRSAPWRLTPIDSDGVWFTKPESERFLVPVPSAGGNGSSVQSMLVDGLHLLEQDRLADALEMAHRILAAGVSIEGAHMLEAAALLRMGRDAEGISALRREIAAYPGNAAARGALDDILAPAEAAVQAPGVSGGASRRVS